MDKIPEREVAWRIFAWEFNRSTLNISEGEERSPNYIITPTGVKCNRLFIVGVATEVDNIGKENSLWRGRIADPTGVFTVYAGHYQPEAEIFLSELNIPAYVAMVGKARKFEPEDGSIYTSIRPEEMNNADEKLRDRWVLDTAERTLERIECIEDALSSGRSGDDLKEYLIGKGINAVLADGAAKAVQYYKNLDRTIAELRDTVIHAIESIAPVEKHKKDQLPPKIDEAVAVEENAKPVLKEPENEPKEIIAGIIDKMDTGKGISYSTVAEVASEAGIDPEILESSIKELMDEGRCYEQKIGVLRKV